MMRGPVIRGAEQPDTDDATVIRGTQDAGVSNDSATILRAPGSEDGQATILRSGSQMGHTCRCGNDSA